MSQLQINRNEIDKHLALIFDSAKFRDLPEQFLEIVKNEVNQIKEIEIQVISRDGSLKGMFFVALSQALDLTSAFLNSNINYEQYKQQMSEQKQSMLQNRTIAKQKLVEFFAPKFYTIQYFTGLSTVSGSYVYLYETWYKQVFNLIHHNLSLTNMAILGQSITGSEERDRQILKAMYDTRTLRYLYNTGEVVNKIHTYDLPKKLWYGFWNSFLNSSYGQTTVPTQSVSLQSVSLQSVPTQSNVISQTESWGQWISSMGSKAFETVVETTSKIFERKIVISDQETKQLLLDLENVKLAEDQILYGLMVGLVFLILIFIVKIIYAFFSGYKLQKKVESFQSRLSPKKSIQFNFSSRKPSLKQHRKYYTYRAREH